MFGGGWVAAVTSIDDGVEQILEHLVGLLVTSHTPHGVDERMTWVVHTSLDHLLKVKKKHEKFIHKELKNNSNSRTYPESNATGLKCALCALNVIYLKNANPLWNFY